MIERFPGEWFPEPRSVRAFTAMSNTIRIAQGSNTWPPTPHQLLAFESKTLGLSIAMAAHVPDEQLADQVLLLRDDLSDRIELELKSQGRVADVEQWSLRLRIDARIKTWPVIPGITTNIPMPGGAS